MNSPHVSRRSVWAITLITWLIAVWMPSAAYAIAPAVFAGNGYTTAIDSTGTAWGWGRNWGQLGPDPVGGSMSGSYPDSSTPVEIPKAQNAIAIAGSYALKSDGTVWSLDALSGPDGTQIEGLYYIVAIAAGSSHTLALRSDGTVWAWGSNSHGELGNGTLVDTPTPVQVPGLDGVIDIAAGVSHSVALKSDGTVWTWGWGSHGQLGNGGDLTATGSSAVYESSPTQVVGLTGVAAIAAGTYFSVALKSDGSVWAWGDNYRGELGNGLWANSSVPVQVTGVSEITAISACADASHIAALKADGTVWTWGGDEDVSYLWGQSQDTYPSSRTPVQVQGLSEISGVAVGGGGPYVTALRSDGTVWAWGYNNHGQLGDGSTTTSGTPVQALGAKGIGYLDLGSTSLGGGWTERNSPAEWSTYFWISMNPDTSRPFAQVNGDGCSRCFMLGWSTSFQSNNQYRVFGYDDSGTRIAPAPGVADIVSIDPTQYTYTDEPVDPIAPGEYVLLWNIETDDYAAVRFDAEVEPCEFGYCAPSTWYFYSPSNFSSPGETTQQANLSVTGADSNDPAVEYGPLTYTWTIGNSGPDTASAVALSVELDAGDGAFDYEYAAASQGDCSHQNIVGARPSTKSSRLSCDLGTLVAGASATITLSLTPTAAGTFTMVATVTSTESDSDASNNQATEQTTVQNAISQYSVSGNVTTVGRRTSAPLSGVRIKLQNENRRTVSITTTDRNGQYVLDYIRAGTYYLVPSKRGYRFTPTYQQIVVEDTSLSGVDFSASSRR